MTDQTSAHDALNGYVPNGLSLQAALALRERDPSYLAQSLRAMGGTCAPCSICSAAAASSSTTATTSAPRRSRQASATRSTFPGFVPEYIRPLFCEGKGPFRWAALSGNPDDIGADRPRGPRSVPARRGAGAMDSVWPRERVTFQGLPARICWLGYGARAQFGLRINDMVRRGEINAPIVIGRDHLDTGSVASPHRETEAMRDGSDAIADWPILNALLNTAAGPPGCRSTTVAESASANRCTPAWSSSPTDRRRRRAAGACADLRSRPWRGAPCRRRLPRSPRAAAERGVRLPMPQREEAGR